MSDERSRPEEKQLSGRTSVFLEETAAEPGDFRLLEARQAASRSNFRGASAAGAAAFILALLSLFMFPVLLGTAGLILGITAARAGSGIGFWGAGISLLSILAGLFILPFFV